MAPVRRTWPHLAGVATWARCSLLVASVVMAGASLAARTWAQPAAAPPQAVCWQKRLLFIPYQVNNRSVLNAQISKVQLLMSRNGTSDWRLLQEATPAVRGFAYHAPEDGDYWFALRHLDRQGRPWPNHAVDPQMRVAIDTVLPELQINGSLGPLGKISIRYQSRDTHLRPESLVVEARVAQGTWSTVQLGPPEVSQPDRLGGVAQWSIPRGADQIEIRASIADQAGHRAQAVTDLLVTGPSLQMPADQGVGRARPREPVGNTNPDPFQAAATRAARDWPADNRLPQRNAPALTTADPRQAESSPWPTTESPPLQNPYTAGREPSGPNRTPAQLVADELFTDPPLPDDTPRAPAAGDPRWTSPDPAAADAMPRTVNSRTFDVDYDLQSVGPWGVSRVELWGTHDGGQTWQSYGVDQDNRSPVRANVAGAGVYGFRILVDGANGVRAAPPRPGDQPELVVAVDLQPPQAEIRSARLGEGNLAGHLHLTWAATDANLEPRPIGLFYSAYPNGPWSTIAAGLENTGAYTWRLERHIPDRFFLRLEVRDVAGNLATHQYPGPITLVRPRPTGRLRSVRPVTQPQDH